MKEEDEQFWDSYRIESFEAIRAVINRIEQKLKVYPSKDAFEYLKPIRYLICEAEMQLDEHRNERIDGADEIINSVL